MGLDLVEMVTDWENSFGIKLDNSELIDLLTPREVVDLISTKLQATDKPSFCPSLRAYYLFQSGVRHASGKFNLKVKLSDKISTFHKGSSKSYFWIAFQNHVNLTSHKPPFYLMNPPSVRAWIEHLTATNLKCLLKAEETWTRSLVRYGVRSTVYQYTNTKNFSDNDAFVQDMGLD